MTALKKARNAVDEAIVLGTRLRVAALTPRLGRMAFEVRGREETNGGEWLLPTRWHRDYLLPVEMLEDGSRIPVPLVLDYFPIDPVRANWPGDYGALSTLLAHELVRRAKTAKHLCAVRDGDCDDFC